MLSRDSKGSLSNWTANNPVGGVCLNNIFFHKQQYDDDGDDTQLYEYINL